MIEAEKQYKHFKGSIYTVLANARFVSGKEDNHVIVYQGSDGRVWVRDYEDFTSKVFIPTDPIKDAREFVPEDSQTLRPDVMYRIESRFTEIKEELANTMEIKDA